MEASITEEKNPSRISAIFNNEAEAKKAQTLLIDSGGFADNKINIIRPHDDDISKKLEPETGGVKRTIYKSHVVLGIVGIIVGLVLAAVVQLIGPDFMSGRTPTIYAIFAMIFGMLGLMLAGLISLRPDHDPVTTHVVEAVQEGKWALILQTHNKDEADRAAVLLKPVAHTIHESL